MNYDSLQVMSLGILAVFTLIFVVIFVLYLLSLSKALHLAGPQNRKMGPGLVWLNLIPIFNLGWGIYTVLKVSEAITNKHIENGTPDPSAGAKTIGLFYTILGILSFLPFVGLIAFILWIVYWVKVSGYNAVMQQMSAAPEVPASA